MPLTTLLCEGTSGSPDARVLRQILRGVVGVVQPMGGKDGLPVRIAARRETGIPSTSSCGALGDGDFPRQPETWAPSDDARPWIDKRGNQVGWLWRRKEIENYLFDVDVLTRVFSWKEARRALYVHQLSIAHERAAVSTAARMALTCHAPSKGRLDTNIDPRLSEQDIGQKLLERATAYATAHRVDAAVLEARWKTLIPECQPGGRFHANAGIVFSGKDICHLLVNAPGIQDIQPELKSKVKLVERVLLAMEQDDSPHEWLPEWRSLRAAVEAWSPVP